MNTNTPSFLSDFDKIVNQSDADNEKCNANGAIIRSYLSTKEL